MARAAAKRLEKEIRNTRTWVVKRKDFIGEQLPYLARGLADDSLRGLLRAASSLDFIATYYGNRGTIRVIDGDGEGWEFVHRAIAYRFWTVRIRAKAYRNTAFLGQFGTRSLGYDDASVSACLACYSTVARLQQSQTESLDFLRLIAGSSAPLPESFWQERVFEPFVLRLHQKLMHFELPEDIEARDLGPYGLVLDNWDNPDALREAIVGISDYHCENLEDRTGNRTAEFEQSPFDLLPCEVLAIYAIRGQMGLQTPEIDHPLLSTPLARMEPIAAPVIDEPLRRVETAYNRVFA